MYIQESIDYVTKIKPKTRPLHLYWYFHYILSPFNKLKSLTFIISLSIKYQSRNEIPQF